VVARVRDPRASQQSGRRACVPNTVAPPLPKGPLGEAGTGLQSPERTDGDGHDWRDAHVSVAPPSASCLGLWFVTANSQFIAQAFQLREGTSSVLLQNLLWKAGEITEIHFMSSPSTD